MAGRTDTSATRNSATEAKRSNDGGMRPTGLYPRVNIELIQDYADAEALSKGKTKNEPTWCVRLHIDMPIKTVAEFDAIVADLVAGKRGDAKDKVKKAVGADGSDPKKERARKFIEAAFD